MVVSAQVSCSDLKPARRVAMSSRILSKSRVERAKRSSLVTISISPRIEALEYLGKYEWCACSESCDPNDPFAMCCTLVDAEGGEGSRAAPAGLLSERIVGWQSNPSDRECVVDGKANHWPPRQLWRIRPEPTSHTRDIAESSAVFASARSAPGSLCISLSPVRTAFHGGSTRRNGRQQL
jgi:hypothetical protein